MDASSDSCISPPTAQSQTLPPPQPQTSSPLPQPGKTTIRPKVGSKKRAWCWSHAKEFEEVNEHNSVVRVFARCDYCPAEYASNSKTCGNNGISNHAKACKFNPNFVDLSNSSSQTKLTQSTMTNATTSHTFSQKRLENKIVEFVIKDEMPFRVVEGIGFNEMLKEAQPRYKPISRQKVSSSVWNVFLTEKQKIRNVIGGNRVSITTDTWTSVQNINYMVITAHFIDDGWKLHKRIINFTKITSHKGDDIGTVLETCLNEWGINKLFTITVDNASANDKAVEFMGKSLNDAGNLLFDGKYLHLRCTCHIINLIVKSGLKLLNQSVESIRNCVKYIHSSASRLDYFRECAVLLNLSKMLTVPLDVSTRWNSTYTMLSEAYKCKAVFIKMLRNAQFVGYFKETEGSVKRVGPPDEMDWEKSQIFVHYLKRFFDTTIKVSGTKYVTSSLVWEEIVSVGTSIIQTARDTTNPILQEVSEHMQQKFKKYWGDLDKVNKLIFLGHVLDPRYKLQMIEIHLNGMTCDAGRILLFVKELKECLTELYYAYKGNSTSIPFGGDVDAEAENDILKSLKDDPIKLNHHMLLVQARKSQNQVEITNEVDKYLADPFVQWSQDFSILEWWKGNTMSFPILSKIAKDVLAIPASTVASESAFSLGRRIVDPFRASLHPKMVEALVCSCDWLRAEEFNYYKEPTEEELEFYKACEEVVTSTPKS